MAILRKKELRDLGTADLEKKATELEADIARERGLVQSTGRPANAGKYREMRRLRARLLTLLSRRKRAAPAKPAKPRA